MRRHELDLLSLVVGLLFIAGGVLALVAPDLRLDIDHRWVLVALLLGLGLGGLAASARSARPGRSADSSDSASRLDG